MQIPEFIRSGLGIIAEFHGIKTGFPNQAEGCFDESKFAASASNSSIRLTMIPTLSVHGISGKDLAAAALPNGSTNGGRLRFPLEAVPRVVPMSLLISARRLFATVPC